MQFKYINVALTVQLIPITYTFQVQSQQLLQISVIYLLILTLVTDVLSPVKTRQYVMAVA